MVGHILRGPDMSLTPVNLARNLNGGSSPALSQELIRNSSRHSTPRFRDNWDRARLDGAP